MKASLLLLLFSFSVVAQTLIITDSHGEGSFGGKLVELIENQNEQVSIYAVGGSRPKDWVYGLDQIWGYWEYHTSQGGSRGSHPKTPLLLDLLKQQRPHRVIIELGTNLIWNSLSESDQKEIEVLTQWIRESGALCIWVGPPDLRPNNHIYESRELEIHQLLTSAVPQHCQLIKSWEFTHYPETGGDGIHYDQIPQIGASLAWDWAQKAVAEMSRF